MFPHDLPRILTPMIEDEKPEHNIIYLYLPQLQDMIHMSFPVLPYDLMIKVLIEARRYLTLPNTPPADIRIVFDSQLSLSRFLRACRHRVHESNQLKYLMGDSVEHETEETDGYSLEFLMGQVQLISDLK